MASIQRKGFTQSQNQLSLIFKALSHPARIAILDKIIQNEALICKDFSADLPITQPTISHHLKILFESGILGYEKVQNVTYYRVNPMMLESSGKQICQMAKETNSIDHDYSETFFKVLPESA